MIVGQILKLKKKQKKKKQKKNTKIIREYEAAN